MCPWTRLYGSTPYQAHLKNKRLVESKRSKMGWNRKRSLFKIHRNCSSPATELGTHKSQCGGYITRHRNWMNSYWMFWIGRLSWRFSVSSFCDFWKMTFCDFIRINFFPFGKSNPLIFQMCFIRRTVAYLCLNMTNFDPVDISEHRSAKVISFFWRTNRRKKRFFWRSVYWWGWARLDIGEGLSLFSFYVQAYQIRPIMSCHLMRFFQSSLQTTYA